MSGRFEINQLLFADDAALVVDSEEKLCRLVSEFGRVCERRKLRVNEGKSKVMSKVMRSQLYGNWDRMCGTCHMASTFMPHPRTATSTICFTSSLLLIKFTFHALFIFTAANDF